MTFDDLQKQWQESNASKVRSLADPDEVLRICRRVEKSNSSICRRDIIETIAAIFVIYIFGNMAFSLENYVAKSGAIICVCSALWIIYKLHNTRKVQGESRPELSVREYYRLEITRAEKQIRLLQTIAFWYISPCIIGANLVFAGGSNSWIAPTIYFVCTMLFGWFVYALNQRAVNKHFVPLYEELKFAQKELDEANFGEPESNT